MAVAVGVWSHAFVPGKLESVFPAADLRIANASLGDILVDEKGRTILKMTFENISEVEDDEGEEEKEKGEGSTSTAVVCSLTPGKTEQTVLDITLMEDTEYIFEVVGKNTVYLIGNYIDQNINQPPFEESETGMSDVGLDGEEAYDLREVSSDVEVHPDDLDGMDSDASQVAEGAAKSKKRARESDAAEDKPASKAEKKNKKQKVEVPTEKAEKADKTNNKGKKSQAEATVKELPGGLKIQDAKIGNGAGAKKGQKIEMRYIGKLANGKVFDSNTKGGPFKFVLGAGEVISGWDKGLAGIKVGGERVLTIPPAMGYGKRGSGAIPGNATLTFEVKCIGIK